jgi:hypothetical protein
VDSARPVCGQGEVNDGSGCKIPLGAVEKVKEVKKSSVNVNEYLPYFLRLIDDECRPS